MRLSKEILGGAASLVATLLHSGRPSSLPAKRGTTMTLLLRVVCAVFVVLCFGEIAARHLLLSPTPQQYDAEIGFSYRPHADVFWGLEGFAHNRYNSLGLNSDELGPRRRPWRVLIIGDSYSEARHLPRSDNFASVAERLEPRLEVINAGRDGLNLATWPIVARRLVPTVKPDKIIIILSQGRLDDLSDELVQVTTDDFGAIRHLTYRIEASDSLKVHLSAIMQRSALATILAHRYKDLLTQKLRSFSDGVRALSQSFVVNSAARAHEPAAAAAARPVSNEDKMLFVLMELREIAPVAILYMPHLDYLPGNQAVIAASSLQRATIMRHLADEADVPFYAAIEEFLRHHRETGQTLHGFANSEILGGHLNVRGHAALGDALAQFARQLFEGS